MDLDEQVVIEARIRGLQAVARGYGQTMKVAYQQACEDCLQVVREPLKSVSAE